MSLTMGNTRWHAFIQKHVVLKLCCESTGKHMDHDATTIHASWSNYVQHIVYDRPYRSTYFPSSGLFMIDEGPILTSQTPDHECKTSCVQATPGGLRKKKTTTPSIPQRHTTTNEREAAAAREGDRQAA